MTLAFISHSDCLLHEMGELHPEQPGRIIAIEKAIENANLPGLKKYSAPLATREQLLSAHDENYVDQIFSAKPADGLLQLDPDTAMNAHTLQAALRSAGSVIKAVDLVMQKETKTAFCNVRPPGHHAEKNKAMGFCFFNNVAVGVAYAMNRYQISRIAIIDFDVHHGNGTEDIFKNENRVLFCSSFQNPFYPFTGTDTFSDHILNLPLPAGTTGQTFKEKISEVWLPKLREFKPELIFISAGFDAYIHDAMANLCLEEKDYAWITREIKKIADEFAQGRVISVLEGGYDLQGLAHCAVAHISELI